MDSCGDSVKKADDYGTITPFLKRFRRVSPGAFRFTRQENREGGANPPRAQRCEEDGRCTKSLLRREGASSG
jgi:hypothetical protein